MGVAVLFPGQGTQLPQMGQPWRAHPAWWVVDTAESVLGEALGHLLLDADAGQLARTREAQLAVMLTSLVAWEAARPEIREPVAFAGHSLGQITALVAAGILDLEEGLQLAARRAEYTQAAADARPGRMAALMGGTLEQAEQACEGVECWVANDNAPGQVVIGGTAKGVDEACSRARETGIKKVAHLSVGGAFHTPLMAQAKRTLEPALSSTVFQPGTTPVVSNVDARAYSGDHGWKQHLADHLVEPVRWRESMETMAGQGVTTFFEVGPGGVLAGLASRTVPTVEVKNVSVPEDLTGLKKAAEVEVA